MTTLTIPRTVWALLPRWTVGMLLILASLAPSASADELLFTDPSFFPGDAVLGSPAGMQVEADVALGGDQLLVVWSDGRSTPDDYYPFATEGSGTDIYGARIGPDGQPIDVGPILIDQRFGDQTEPRVAWNGENWLVVWEEDEAALPTYEELRAVRVSPEGVVLDDPPILIHRNQTYYSGTVVEGGPGEWVVLTQANGPVDGILAIRVAGDGTVLNPGGLSVHATNFLLDFDLVFAQDEYMVVWGGVFDSPRAKRYTTDLQTIGTSVLPFARRVATDGTDFIVVYASGSPPLATVEGVIVSHDGGVGSPFTLFTGGNQDPTCCANATWDGSRYWVSWGGPRLARVTPTGDVLDPGGFWVTPGVGQISSPRYQGIPGGGVQLVFNNGVNGSVFPKDVYGGQVTPDGAYQNEVLISTAAPAQLASDFAEGDGTHLVVFISRRSDSGRILAQRINGAGIALDAEPIEVATGPIPGDGLPSLGNPAAAWNGSVFMITWSDGISVLARRMLPDGSFLDETPRTVMDGRDPDVAAVGEVFLVVGLDYLNDNPHWQATHSMRVDGVTGENLDTQPYALGGFVIFARHPHVVAWGDRWLAVWQLNLSHDNPVASTVAAFVDTDGTTPGIIDVPLGWRPDVAVSDNAAMFVAVTNSIASATTDLAGALMAPDGSFPGGSFAISEADGKQLMPAVTWNGAEFVVAWEDKRNAAIYFDQRTDIYGSRIDAAGNVLDPLGVAIAATPVPEIQPALQSIGGATLLAVSTLRTEPQIGSYRIGIQLDGQSAGVDPGIEAPEPTIRLFGARPNPTISTTKFRFQVGETAPVTLRLFHADGRLVRTLIDHESFAPGSPIEVDWDGLDNAGRPVRAGVYFYELRTRLETTSARLVVLE